MKLTEVDVAVDAGAELGEGPVWDQGAARLIWVDILGNVVHRFDPATGKDVTLDVGRRVGAAALREQGGLVLAVEDGFALVDRGWTGVELVAPVGADDPAIRFNDGKADPDGRFWAGTLAYDGSVGAASLYRLGPDRRVEEILSAVTISNGLAWSSDRRTMYFIDSPTQGVDAFDYHPESGSIENRRRVIDLPEADGMPDGMTIDAEGCLWVALWGGWSVRRYRTDGRLDRVVELPTAHVTSCTFGGPDLQDLYVTSARDGLTEDDVARQRYAGAVFRCATGVAGTLPDRFAG
jgi:sugar lactone lactonase YvrE